MRVTRRNLLGAGAAGLAAAGWAGSAGEGRAAEQGTARTGQNPPVYRTRLGTAKIMVVSDGTIGFPPAMVLPEVPDAEREAFLAARFQPLDNLPLQLNAVVADIGGRRVLVDTGCGAKFDPSAGRLPGNLRAAGIEPASIDTIVVTHLHPDHFWGATDAANEEAVFGNAEIVVPAAELDFWNDRELAPAMPEGLFREVAVGTHAHLRRLDDRLRPVETPGEAVPGIRFVPTPGHTPGHASLMIESDGEALMSTGDAVADPFVSLERPDWHFLTDWDAETAVTTRRALLAQAADERMRVFGFHMPWPGFGHVARQGESFRWIPEKWVWDA